MEKISFASTAKLSREIGIETGPPRASGADVLTAVAGRDGCSHERASTVSEPVPRPRITRWISPKIATKVPRRRVDFEVRGHHVAGRPGCAELIAIEVLHHEAGYSNWAAITNASSSG